MGDIAVVWEHADLLAQGLVNTIVLAVVGAAAALVFGSLIAILLVSPHRSLRFAMQAAVDLLRCVPFLLLAYLVYYGLPSVGLTFDNWTTGLGAIALYNTAYMAEILRSAWSRMRGRPSTPPRPSVSAGPPSTCASCCRHCSCRPRRRSATS